MFKLVFLLLPMNMEMTAGCGSRNAIVTENLISADAENERMSGQLPPWKIAPPG